MNSDLTDDLWIVDFGDRQTSGGLVASQDPDRTAAPVEFRDIAQSLMRDSTVCQPPTDMLPTRPHPVWSLRPVQVRKQDRSSDQDRYWCFAVQGRGDTFSEGGTCQFAFRPAQVDPADMWSGCVGLVGADGLLDDQAVPRAPDPSVSDDVGKAIREIIDGLLWQRRRVGVGGTPAVVAAAIARVLTVLPVPVITNYAWSSWLLVAPHSSGLGAVAGRWPEEKRANRLDLPQQVDQWLRDPQWQPPPADEGLGRHYHAEVLAWLTDHALRATGPRDRPYPKTRTMAELADAVARDKLGKRPVPVSAPGSVAVPVPAPAPVPDPPTERLGQGQVHQGLVHQGQVRRGPQPTGSPVAAQPEDVIRALCAKGSWDRGDDLNRVRELLEEMRHTKKNVAYVPPRPAPSGCLRWPDLLAGMLREMYPTRDWMDGFIENYLTAPGMPLADRAAQTAARDWLDSLRSPESAVRSTEPPEPPVPAQPDSRMTDVEDPRANRIEPAMARNKLIACASARVTCDVRALTAEFVRCNGDSWDDAVRWLCELLDLLDEARGDPLDWAARRAIAESGVEQIAVRHGNRPLPAQLILRWLRLQAQQPGLPAIQRLLIHSTFDVVTASLEKPGLIAPRWRAIKGRVGGRIGERRHESPPSTGRPAPDDQGPETRGTGSARHRHGGAGFSSVGLAWLAIVIFIVIMIAVVGYRTLFGPEPVPGPEPNPPVIPERNLPHGHWQPQLRSFDVLSGATESDTGE